MYDIFSPANNARVKIRYYEDEQRVEVRSPFANNNRVVLSVFSEDIDWDGMAGAWVGTLPADKLRPLALTLKTKWMGAVKIETAPRPAPTPSPTQIVSSVSTSWNVEVL